MRKKERGLESEADPGAGSRGDRRFSLRNGGRGATIARGGWESLALQVKHPDFLGGAWTLYPDPVDFHHYQLTDIYSDSNAFYQPGYRRIKVLRPEERQPDGQPDMTTEQESQLEEVLVSHGRSGQQLDAGEAGYGPVGQDGYSKPLWKKNTRTIGSGVADYMRDHGYGLIAYLATWRYPYVQRTTVGRTPSAAHDGCGYNAED